MCLTRQRQDKNEATPPDPESPVTDIDEDCLNLNIAMLSGTKDSKELLPVLVWIYGGGSINSKQLLKFANVL
jgi:carboxylesterase type B